MLQHTNIQPPIMWPHRRMDVGQDEFGSVSAQHMPARRKPQLAKAGIVLQEAVILSFTNGQFHCTLKTNDARACNTCDPDELKSAAMASSTRLRGAIPSGIWKFGRRLCATRGSFLDTYSVTWAKTDSWLAVV